MTMRKPIWILLLIFLSFSAGIVALPVARYAKRHVASFRFVLGDDTRSHHWAESFSRICIPSSFDSTEQNAYAHFPVNRGAQPLVVSLHSWSADYTQYDPIAELCAAAGWNYIHPNFRGPNNTRYACASTAALVDIDDAIDFAIENSDVDEHYIYVVGGSGGGHACCAISLASKHRIRASFAWVPITDIAAWYHQSLDRGTKYASDIQSVLQGSDDFYDAARLRSPMSMSLPLRTGKIHLFAGVRDGYDGSVPISHSIEFFNRLCKELDVPDSMVSEAELVALMSRDVRGPVARLGDRYVYFQRHTDFGSLTIFDGDHETLYGPCFDLLVEDFHSNTDTSRHAEGGEQCDAHGTADNAVSNGESSPSAP